MIDMNKGSLRAVRSSFSRGLWGSAVSISVLFAASNASADHGATQASAATAVPSTPAASAPPFAPTVEARAGSNADPCPCAKAVGAKEPQGPLVDRWYGLQTLAFDGAALAFFATYAATGATGDVLPVLSGASYLGGGPIVHLAHGHVDKAFISLGLRGGIPLAFGVAGAMIAAESHTPSNTGDPLGDTVVDMYSGFGGLIIGMGIGMAAASALDASLVANERVPAPAPREAGKISSLAPSVSMLPRGGAMVTLSGSIF